MRNTVKKAMSVILAILMVATAIPLSVFADNTDTGMLWISTATTGKDIEVNDDVVLSYEVLFNGEAYNGTAKGDDGNEYTVENGVVSFPHNVKAVIEDIPAGTAYAVKRRAYDNDVYALVDESEFITGKVAENTYYLSKNGADEITVTYAEFNEGTNNGTVLEYKTHKDAAGNLYDESQLSSIVGYTSAKDNNNREYVYATDSLEKIEVKLDASYGTVTSTGSFVKTHKATASYTFTCDGFETKTGSVTGSSVTGKDAARTAASDEIKKQFTAYAEQIYLSILENTDKTAVYLSKGSLTGLQYTFTDLKWGNGNQDNSSDSSSIEIATFTDIEHIDTYVYRVEYGEAEKTAEFALELKPAPTGTFQVNFALDDTVPTGYENAVFEIKDSLGNVLTDGVDYTLEKSPFSLDDLTKGVLKWGLTIYKFSGLKHGDYTISQKTTANGYKLNTEIEYAFNVARKDGKVTGENFDTCAINSNIPCLYNADKSINILVTKIKLYLFMNESFDLSFNVKDQNKEAVKDSQFLLVDRKGLLDLVGQIGGMGINNIGNLDISGLISSLGGLDFSNLDAATIFAILGAVIDLIPDLPEGTKLTIPAILTASSKDNGVVKFNNASNMMNVLETIANLGEAADAESVAETIKNLLGSSVPEEYLDTLVKLAKYTKILDVHTGIPAGYYVLLNSAAPNGYDRNPVLYTINVSNDGRATTNAGILIPVIAEVLNERLNLDLYEILINEEEFDNISGTVKNVFGTFTEYAGYVLDFVCDVIGDDLAGIVTSEQIQNLKQDMLDRYEQYDDLSLAIKESVADFNESIKGDLTEDWVYTNNRYFLDVSVSSKMCNGTDLAMTVTDSDKNVIDVVNGKVTLPYGKYTFALVDSTNKFKTEDSSSYVLEINDHNARYSVSYRYHEQETVIGTEPTCVDKGLTDGEKCGICNTILVAQKEIDANGHTVVVDKAVAPKCLVSGLTEGSHCDVCKEVLVAQQVVEPTGHTEVKYGEDKDPTCTEDGSISGLICSVCDVITVYPEVIDNLGHSPVDLVAVNATCTSTGLTEGSYCNVCKEILVKQEIIDMLPHTPVSANNAVAAGCVTSGKESDIICDVCKNIITEGKVLEPNGHSPKDAVEENVVLSTCTEEGSYDEVVYCSVCENELSRVTKTIKKLPHVVVTDDAIDATCTSEGLTEGSHCEVCNTVLVAQITIDKLPHTVITDVAVVPTCTSTGLTEGSHCEVCDTVLVAQEVINKLPHEYSHIEVEPGCEIDGYAADVCAVCGTTDNMVVIPKLYHSFVKIDTVDGVSTFKCERCDKVRTMNDCKYCEKALTEKNPLFRFVYNVVNVLYHVMQIVEVAKSLK